MIFAQPGTSGLFAAAILVSLATDSAPSKAENAISGIFSNVQLSPETGDLGGLEIEFHTGSPKPYVFVVFCEGWCNQAHRVPVKLSGSRFSLAFSETLTDSSGVPVGEDDYRVEGRLVGRSLLVELRLNNYRWRSNLSLRATRFGLDVAHPPAQFPGPVSDNGGKDD